MEYRDKKEKQAAAEKLLAAREKELREKDKRMEKEKIEVSQRAATIAVREK